MMIRTFVSLLGGVALATTISACGGGGSGSADASGGGGADGGGGGDAGEDLLGLVAPTNGFQVRSVGTTIEPGEDIEYCEVGVVPGTPADTYYVNRLEFAMTESSHHLIVTAAIPGSPTEANMEIGDRVLCPIGSRVFGEDFTSVGGSQQVYNDESLPAGIGRVFHGGQKLVFDYHYFNSGEAAVEARAAVNFHRVDSIEKEARTFGFYNFAINTASGESRSHNAECMFERDVIVHKVTRHTHQWTNDFDVWFAGGPRDAEHIWTSPHYEEVDHVFDAPITVPAGQGFQWECDIQNTTDHSLGFGITAQDEMCILFGIFWNADDAPPVDQGCQRGF